MLQIWTRRSNFNRQMRKTFGTLISTGAYLRSNIFVFCLHHVTILVFLASCHIFLLVFCHIFFCLYYVTIFVFLASCHIFCFSCIMSQFSFSKFSIKKQMGDIRGALKDWEFAEHVNISAEWLLAKGFEYLHFFFNRRTVSTIYFSGEKKKKITNLNSNNLHLISNTWITTILIFIILYLEISNTFFKIWNESWIIFILNLERIWNESGMIFVWNLE